MIDYEKLTLWLEEQMESEKRMMELCTNINSPDSAMAIGSYDAYVRVLEFINGEIDD